MKAKYVLTISQFSFDDIRRRIQRKQNLSYIYNAFESQWDKLEPLVKEKTYILAMTSTLPHKNCKGVIETYGQYCNEGGKLPMKVIGIKNPEPYKHLINASFFDRIEFLPFLSDEALYATIRSAKIFLFLSEIEGFGYPPIEAMDLGTLVVSSTGGSLAEVVADGGILVNNKDEAVKGLLRLENDIDLQKSLLSKAQKNVQRFNQLDYRTKFNAYLLKCIGELE
jgi:glycosyltransferase involved in cell wall biosynthesis